MQELSSLVPRLPCGTGNEARNYLHYITLLSWDPAHQCIGTKAVDFGSIYSHYSASLQLHPSSFHIHVAHMRSLAWRIHIGVLASLLSLFPPSTAILYSATVDRRHSLRHARDQASADSGLKSSHVCHHCGGGRGQFLSHEGTGCR